MDIILDGPIGDGPNEVSSSYVRQQLARADGKPISVTIHSEGGSVFEGFCIHDLFAQYQGQKRCIVNCAFSIASLIAMAFEHRAITENGYLMIHSPYTEDGDQPKLLGKLKDRMISIYSRATQQSYSFIEKLMNAESFLDSRESIANRFINGLVGSSPKALASSQALLRSHAGFASHVMARAKPKAIPRAATVQRIVPRVSAAVRWRNAVQARVDRGMSHSKAMIEVDKENPRLREAFIAEANRR
jgi:ATP-dependent protease ClpP protease subunit